MGTLVGFLIIFAGLVLLIAVIINKQIEKYAPDLEITNDIDGNKVLVLWYNDGTKRKYKTWILKRK